MTKGIQGGRGDPIGFICSPGSLLQDLGACRRREAPVVSNSDEISLHNHSVGVGSAASHAATARPGADSARVATAAPRDSGGRSWGGPAPSRLGPAEASELFQGSGVGKKTTQSATCRVSRLDSIRQLSRHTENHCA